MAATPTPVLPTPTAVISATPTAAPSPTATKKEEQPPLLTRLLQKYGYAIDDIDADQLMLLGYDNGVSTLYLYDKDSDAGLWRLAYSFDAHVGKNGITDNKTEGDKKTPTGYYALGFAFGNEAKPDTQWTYRDVTPNSYWVDDPDSASYNTWVEDTGDRDWNSAEHLSDVPIQYAYALVIEYNTDPIVPGKGSAIFLHCGTGTTAGCIAIARSDMLTVLKWLKPDSNAHILIADAS
jgi:L,D-peptidoglycan transpeptidase YkuD (ErfK/YbiS/YcfS/YnhG family)